MHIRPATVADLAAIEALRVADSSALGFIPKQRFESLVRRTASCGRQRWKYESLSIVEDNTEITGFCYAGFHRAGMKIEQLCIRQDARRIERASALLHTIEACANRQYLTRARCRVAADLEANLFWQAVGYQPIGQTTSTWLNQQASKSKRPLIVYEKWFQRPLAFILEGASHETPTSPI